LFACSDSNNINRNSLDPASDHSADSTGLYSKGGWIEMPFCEGDRDAQEIGRKSISE